MKKTLAAVAATAACLTLAACGDDSKNSKDGDDKSSAALTKAEFIKQGDAICKAGNEEMDADEEYYADPENPTQEEFRSAVLELYVPSLEKQVAQLRELVPPAEDADTIKRMLDVIEEGTAELKADPLVLVRGDAESEANRLVGEANKIAKDYGFTVCAQDD